MQDLVSEDVIDEVIDESEKSNLHDIAEGGRRRRTETEYYRESFRAWRAARAASSTTASSGASSSSQRRGKRAPATSSPPLPPFPEGSLDRDQAQALMPPGFAIFRDLTNRRWQAYSLGEVRKHVASKSVSMFSERHAALFCVFKSWLIHEMQGGGQSPHQEAIQDELSRAGLM